MDYRIRLRGSLSFALYGTVSESSCKVSITVPQCVSVAWECQLFFFFLIRFKRFLITRPVIHHHSLNVFCCQSFLIRFYRLHALLIRAKSGNISNLFQALTSWRNHFFSSPGSARRTKMISCCESPDTAGETFCFFRLPLLFLYNKKWFILTVMENSHEANDLPFRHQVPLPKKRESEKLDCLCMEQSDAMGENLWFSGRHMEGLSAITRLT